MTSGSHEPRREQDSPTAPPPIPKRTPTAPPPTPSGSGQQAGSPPLASRMQVRPHEEYTEDTRRKIAELNLELPLKLLLAGPATWLVVVAIYPLPLLMLFPLQIIFAFVQVFRCMHCIGKTQTQVTFLFGPLSLFSLPPAFVGFLSKLMAAGLIPLLFILLLIGLASAGVDEKPVIMLLILTAVLEGGVVWWALQDYLRDFVPHRTLEK